jgi:hypothetical protein
MNSGAIFLAVLALVAVTDVLIAMRYRQLADRADSGEAAGQLDPVQARRIATFMLVFAPIMFFGAVLISFGLIPVGGIDPIKF